MYLIYLCSLSSFICCATWECSTEWGLVHLLGSWGELIDKYLNALQCNFLQNKDRSQDCQQTNLEYPAGNITGYLACYTVGSVPIACVCRDWEWSTLLPKDGKCLEPEHSKHPSCSYELPGFTQASYGSCKAGAAMVSNSLCHPSAAFVVNPSFVPSHSSDSSFTYSKLSMTEDGVL